MADLFALLDQADEEGLVAKGGIGAWTEDLVRGWLEGSVDGLGDGTLTCSVAGGVVINNEPSVMALGYPNRLAISVSST